MYINIKCLIAQCLCSVICGQGMSSVTGTVRYRSSKMHVNDFVPYFMKVQQKIVPTLAAYEWGSVKRDLY